MDDPTYTVISPTTLGVVSTTVVSYGLDNLLAQQEDLQSRLATVQELIAQAQALGIQAAVSDS